MPLIFNQEQTEQIIQEYQAGLSLPELAKKYYVSYPTIRNYLIRKGIARRAKSVWIRRGVRSNADM